MREFIDIQDFIKDIIGDKADIYSFIFADKIEWKKHALSRYGYCDEIEEKVITHLIKHMASTDISVAKYNNDTNSGIVIDRRENIR